LLLGESVSLLRYGSVLLIVIGLVIISRSPYFEK
jgi:drug/metabolite transporter (DMT)-like permease